jgi:hypothetical protein
MLPAEVGQLNVWCRQTRRTDQLAECQAVLLPRKRVTGPVSERSKSPRSGGGRRTPEPSHPWTHEAREDGSVVKAA